MSMVLPAITMIVVAAITTTAVPHALMNSDTKLTIAVTTRCCV